MDGSPHSETIFALSSGKGRAGVAVVRMSGAGSRFALETLSGKPAEIGRARVCRLLTEDGGLIDEAVTLFFEAPHSFTGEDCAEFQVHGGRAVIGAMLNALSGFANCRSAEPGEFTRRALDNGKIDLLGAEALIDLIDAETDAQRKVALAGRSGRFKTEIDALRSQLIEAMALLEADIDFSDEGDVASGVSNSVLGSIETSRRTIERLLSASKRAERVRAGFKVVLAGAVNSGKSTLLNALAKRDVAIVSPIAGTTRDRLEVHLDLDGWPVTIVDTAGFRATDDPIERLGIERAREALAESDLVLHLSKDGAWPEVSSSPAIRVRTQIDSHPIRSNEQYTVALSALTGEGLGSLLDLIKVEAEKEMRTAEEPVAGSRRQLDALAAARNKLGELEIAGRPIELMVEDLRTVVKRLGEIVGHVDSDAVRSLIFSRFCIGK